MANLPIDCIYYILEFNDSYFSKYQLLNKQFNKLFNKKKFIKYSNKIKSWYKKYTFPYNENIIHKSFVSKINTVQYYRKYYPMEYLISYPEFMAKKLNRHDLREYIRANVKQINQRNKKDVIDFLKLKNITKDEIIFCGW